MIAVVQFGTGTTAQIPGVTVAGKTGTAELRNTNNPNNPNANSPKNTDAWFVGYAPVGKPRVVVGALFPNQGAGAARPRRRCARCSPRRCRRTTRCWQPAAGKFVPGAASRSAPRNELPVEREQRSPRRAERDERNESVAQRRPRSPGPARVANGTKASPSGREERRTRGPGRRAVTKFPLREG